MRRWLQFPLLAALFVIGLQSSAKAADAVPATLGGVRVTADKVTGVITLRPGDKVVAVDPGVAVTLGDTRVTVPATPAARTRRTTVLLIDTSGSMGRSGMATVRSAVKGFLASVPKDVRVGVVSFGNTAGPEIAPTTDRVAVQSVVDVLRADGNTALFGGVTQAVKMLGTSGDRSIVLLSDGKNTVGDRAPGLAAAVKALTASQVRVEVVRFTTSENDPEALAAFAKAGGGSVVQASDNAAVRSAFQTAAKVFESQVQLTISRPPGLTGSLPLTIRGTAGGRPFVVKTTVDLGSGSVPEPAPSASGVVTAAGSPVGFARVSSGTSTNLVAAVVAIFIGGLVLVLALFNPFRSKRQDRVAEVQQYSLTGATRASRHTEAQAQPSVIAASAVRMGERVMEQRESTTRTMELIQRADFPLRAGEWFVLRIVALVVGVILVPILVPLPWWLTVPVGLGLGLGVPAFLLRFMAARRAKKFESLLPDVLLLVATTLASGFSLIQALDAIARDAAEPAGKEFSRALAETRIGADVSDALDTMARRMDSESMRWTTMAIRIQRDVGGNLAETLRTTAYTLRERESLKRQVDALSAEGRLSAYVLIALPISLFLYMAWTNPSYTSLLWTTFPGLVMLIGSSLSMAMGALWMRKVVKIEV